MPDELIPTLFIIGLLVHFLVCAGLSAYIADEKGCKGINWFFIGLFSGIHGLIAAAGLPDKFFDHFCEEDEIIENEETN
ncbi:MAG: hypothetical protein PHD83_01655 [Caldisericia bacterium]|nr:hypothetical protein [Caldisericia bacterium]